MQTTNKDIDFINRLTEIVNSNLSDENFGVNELAEKLEISHSQLHRKLRAINDQSASQFIKILRLKKAEELLMHENITISEVAFKVGFSSSSYFNKCFRDYFGYPPGEYKKQLVGDGKSKKDIEIPDSILINNPEHKSVSLKNNKVYKFNNFILVVLLLLIASFVMYYIKDEKRISIVDDKSIAILPLKILYDDGKEQYLANGIMYDIQNRLSHISDLVVKSNIATDNYAIENKTIPKIAKDLNVAYILEGSMLKQGERIRIYVHLIDSKANIVWSDQYDHDLASIFVFVSDVSKNIVQNLLSPLQMEEFPMFEKQYTHDEKAYLLYLEGRFYYRLRTADGFDKSIELYNQALKIDSNYSLAYAGLADSYLTGTWNGFYPVSEGISKCRSYLDKALLIDPNLAEAHVTYGGLATFFDSDYEQAEKHLKLAMELSSGYDRANKIYAEFLDVTSNKEEARKYINKAHFLNPTNRGIIWLSYFFYLQVGDFENALNESLKLYSLDHKKKQYLHRSFEIYLQQHNDLIAFKMYKKFNEENNQYFAPQYLDSIYANSKIKGIIQLIIDETQNNKYDSINVHQELQLAEWYTLIGEKNQAIECLEKSYLKNPGPVHRVCYNVAYESLRSEPKFKALMKKMNQTY